MELKPCPWCQREPHVSDCGMPENKDGLYAWCLTDGCANQQKVYKMSGWNSRASPAPEQSDWERAETLYRNGTEVLDGERFPAAIASLLAAVRAEERERVMPERMAKALAEFHEWGRTTAISLSPQEHELYDVCAAAIRKGEP